MLWNYLNWGGAQIYLLSVVKHAPENWSFKLVVPRRSPRDIVELFEKHGAEVVYQDVALDTGRADSFTRKLKRQKSRIEAELKTYRLIKNSRSKDAVLHVETAPWQSWLYIRLLAGRLPVFVTMHNSLPTVSPLRQKIWRARLKYLSALKGFRLFTSNRDTKKSLKGWVTDEFWEKIRVTYTSVDPSEIEKVLNSNKDRGRLRRKFSVAEDDFLVLCVGQFIDRKGRRVFLEAAEKLLRTDPKLSFLWLTQTEIGDDDRSLIESYALGESFRLIKSEEAGKNRLDILSFFLVADVFALPSYVEGLPIALLEAMALGLPSVSTAVNAIPEAIRHEETGLLTDAGDSAGLAAAIERLKADSALRSRLSEAGRRHVIERFDERVCARTVLAAYEEALEKRN